MELEYLFTPVEFKRINNWRQLPKWAMGRHIEYCNNKYHNSIKQVEVVIIGVEEVRNASEFQKGADVNRIRSMFYQLNNIHPNFKIIDLGNLKLGKRVNDTYYCLQEIVRYLIKNKIRPVILGGTQDLMVPLSKLFTELSGSCVILDSMIDYETKYDLFDADHFINGFSSESISRTSVLGYQNYFIDEQTKHALEEQGMELVRLGKVRDNFVEIEPTIRDARLVTIDAKCIRNGDFKGNRQPSPNGFYAHEICQLSWYAGQSNLTNSLMLNGYQGFDDKNGSDAMLFAQIVWHYAKGVWFGTNDFDQKDTNNMEYYIVEFENSEYSLSFIKNTNTQRWWLAITEENALQMQYHSCSKLDYEQACKNTTTNRVLNILNRNRS